MTALAIFIAFVVVMTAFHLARTRAEANRVARAIEAIRKAVAYE